MKKATGLIPRYLIMQKRRSLLTMLGIILSIALISGIGVLSESIKFGMVEDAENLSGRHHVSFKNLNEDQINVLKNHIKLENAGINMGFGTHKVPHSNFKLSINAFDKEAAELLGMTLESGHYPEKENEIVIENWILEKMNLKPELGQKIMLDFEQQYCTEQNAWITYNTGREEFTLVGILKDIPSTKVIGRSFAITTMDTVIKHTPEDKREVQILARVRKGESIPKVISNIAQNLGLAEKDIFYNGNLLYALGESGKTNWPLVFLGIVIVIATVAAIYNIFHISVMERIKQFGVLRSLGSTPHQIRKILLGEAFIFSIISIPVGMLVGIFGCKFLVNSLSMLQDAANNVVVPIWTIVASIGIGLVTIFISVLNPARLAAKVSPMEALKINTGVIKEGKIKKRKWQTIFERIFGVTGKMAYQNLWRNKKRTVVTIFSICLASILFIIFSFYFAGTKVDNFLSDRFLGEYCITGGLYGDEGYSEEDVLKIHSIKGVVSVLKTQFGCFNMFYSKEEIDPETFEMINTFRKFDPDPETGKYAIDSITFGYSDEVLEKVKEKLIEGTIDVDTMKSESVVLIENCEGVKSFKVGDMIIYRYKYKENNEWKFKELSYTVGGIINSTPTYMGFSSIGPHIVMHQNQFQKDFQSVVYDRLDIIVNEEVDRESLEAKLKKISHSLEDGTVVSLKEETELLEDQLRQLKLMFVSVITVIAIIGVFNIINTISTNLIVRTREFGMLRSIGMTNAQLKRMIQMEGFFYGLIGAFWGSIIGIGLSYVLYLLMRQEATYLQWTIPWLSIIEICVGTMLIATLSTLLPLKRVTSLNIVESVRNVE